MARKEWSVKRIIKEAKGLCDSLGLKWDASCERLGQHELFEIFLSRTGEFVRVRTGRGAKYTCTQAKYRLDEDKLRKRLGWTPYYSDAPKSGGRWVRVAA